MDSKRNSKRKSIPERTHVTVDELIEFYPISRAWVYDGIKSGKIPHRRCGRRVFISIIEFEEFTRREAEHYTGVNP